MNPKISNLRSVKCIELKADERKLFVAISNYALLYDPDGSFSYMNDIEILAGLPMHEAHYDIQELKKAIYDELTAKGYAL